MRVLDEDPLRTVTNLIKTVVKTIPDTNTSVKRIEKNITNCGPVPRTGFRNENKIRKRKIISLFSKIVLKRRLNNFGNGNMKIIEFGSDEGNGTRK